MNFLTAIGFLLLSAIGVENEADPKNISIIATDVDPKVEKLTLHRVTSKDPDSPAIFSKVDRSDQTIRLKPEFSLSPGETYEARLWRDGKVIDRFSYRAPISKSSDLEIQSVHPTTGKVPANLLKFYIEFNQPVKEGIDIFDRIHIVDKSTGKKVHSPWRRQELWSNDSTRFTLWIHPGRVKQGIDLREQMGPVLLPGKNYQLVIDQMIESVNGKRLRKAHVTEFITVPVIRKKIDPANWKIEQNGNRIMIQTDRPMDPFLFRRHVAIYKNGMKIDSKVYWEPSQSKFSFIKEQWGNGDYEVRIGEYLEDLAGNTVVRVFDTDLSSDEEEGKVSDRIHFTLPIPAQ